MTMPRPRVPIADRFWDKVDRTDNSGCWEWRANTFPHGYGAIEGYVGGRKRPLYAHRVAWEITHGATLPSDVWVLHTCDNKVCVNPSHLYLGDHDANVRDAVDRGRYRTGATNGVRRQFTERDVRHIRKRLAEGRLQREVAAEFDTTQQCISKIVTGASYAWVP